LNGGDVLTYLPFVLGSLLFIFIGGMLLFAPEKFVAAGRWWGRKISFPEAHYEWKADRSFTWRNWRLPGLYILCFGLFLLFVILRSLLHGGLARSANAPVSQLPSHHAVTWYALAVDVLPIALGIFVLLRTEAILNRVKRIGPKRTNADYELAPARYLFRVIGLLSVVVGLVFLVRHILSF